jgi:hypothetical protein
MQSKRSRKSRTRKVLKLIAATVGNPNVLIAIVTKETRIGDFFPCLNMRHDICAHGCQCDQMPVEEELSQKLGFEVSRSTRVYSAAARLHKPTLQHEETRLQSL